MSPARAAVLQEAEHEAAILRRCGYPQARVLPEYCIGSEIGPDKILTKTICVYVGDYDPESVPKWLRGLTEKRRS